MKKIYSFCMLALIIGAISIPNFLMAENIYNSKDGNMEFVFEQVKKIKKDGVEQVEIDKLIQVLKPEFAS